MSVDINRHTCLYLIWHTVYQSRYCMPVEILYVDSQLFLTGNILVKMMASLYNIVVSAWDKVHLNWPFHIWRQFCLFMLWHFHPVHREISNRWSGKHFTIKRMSQNSAKICVRSCNRVDLVTDILDKTENNINLHKVTCCLQGIWHVYSNIGHATFFRYEFWLVN